MSNWSIEAYLDDAGPHGVGANNPETGAYKITVIESELRKPRTGSGEPAIYLQARLDSSAQQGMVTSLRIAVPQNGQSAGMLAARTAEVKAALICFGQPADKINEIVNQKVTLSQAFFDNKSGHIWYEKGNEQAPDKSSESYPFYRFISEEVCTRITDGVVRPRLRNLIKTSRQTVSAGNVGAGSVDALAGMALANGLTPDNSGGQPLTQQPSSIDPALAALLNANN